MVKMEKLGCPKLLKMTILYRPLWFYTGHFQPFLVGKMLWKLPDILSKGGVSYPPQSAFCLETQHFPDSPNHINFPSAELSPGEEYEQIATFQFTAE